MTHMDDERLDEAARSIKRILEDADAEAATCDLSLDARPMTPDEESQVAAMREQLLGTGAEPAAVAGASSATVPGSSSATGSRILRFRLFAAAAGLLITVGFGVWLASRQDSAPPSTGTGGPGVQAESPVYLGDPAKDEGRTGGDSPEPLPTQVDWSAATDTSGPYRVVIVDLDPARADESHEVDVGLPFVDEPRWSCPAKEIQRLPNRFRFEVYARFDPPGAEPLWERSFSRPSPR